MSTIELKEELISKIQITENEDLLNGLLQMLAFETNYNEIYQLNDLQKESIAISKKQINNGEVFTEEEANKLTDKWLKA